VRGATIALLWLGTIGFWLPSCAAAVTPVAEVAVTVDDLPTHGPLPRGTTRLAIARQMIGALRKHSAPGVHGFVNGGQLLNDPRLETILREWGRAGFLFGNHTFSHLDLTRVTAAEYIADIERNEALLARLGPAEPGKYFRYPYLQEGDAHEKRDAIRRWLAAHGYTIAQVTVYFEDWAWNDAYARCMALDDETAIARLKVMFMEAANAALAWASDVSITLVGRPIKHVLLVHVGAFDALMLDEVLQAYRKTGAKLIDLGTALRDPVYQKDPNLVWDGERTFLQQLAAGMRVRIPPRPPSRLQELTRLCR
jgi:peptidoglycan/xylan/chitin deacetylase (PgdA/CDA1 family)